MLDDGHAVRQVIVAVRLSDGDGQADGLWEVSYRQSGGDGWADEWSDDEGQSDGWGKMVCRWSDIDGQSDRLIMGLMVGVTDGRVNDKLTGCRMDWSYDRWMGMMDGLVMSQTDSVMDGQVD